MSDIRDGLLSEQGRQDKAAWAAYIDKLNGERRLKAIRQYWDRYNELIPYRQGEATVRGV